MPEERVQGRVLSIDACMNRTPSILSTREIVNLEEVSSFVKDGKLVARGETVAIACNSLEADDNCRTSLLLLVTARQIGPSAPEPAASK